MDASSPKPPANERCVRCGASFGCGAKAGHETCWCMDLPKILPVGEESCLCPDCLKAEIARRQASGGGA